MGQIFTSDLEIGWFLSPSLNGTSLTAVRDLNLLVNKGIIKQKGLKKGAFYEFSLGVNGVLLA